MKTLLAIAFLATTMGTAYAAPVPTPRPCHKILWLFGKNCYQGGEVVKDGNRGNDNSRRGAVSRPSVPAPKGAAAAPDAGPKSAGGDVASNSGGGNINPLGGGGGAGGNPPSGDDPGNGPGLGNPGNDKARGRAGENPGGHDFGPTGSRGRNH